MPLSTALLVENIRIEPDGQRPMVLVHGRACTADMHPKCSIESNKTSRSTMPGMIYALDVAALMGERFGEGVLEGVCDGSTCMHFECASALLLHVLLCSVLSSSVLWHSNAAHRTSFLHVCKPAYFCMLRLRLHALQKL